MSSSGAPSIRTIPVIGLEALAALLMLGPDPAAACATCTSSAFGDLSFTWPHLALLFLPLVVAGGMGGVIVYCHRRGRVDPAGPQEREPSRAESAAVSARPDGGPTGRRP